MSDGKFCPQCGTQVNQDALFCPKCGYQFAPTDGQETPTATPTGSKQPLSRHRPPRHRDQHRNGAIG
ncbi:zinc-ribbon domain-containing protein [Levilactobacillus namurensis]|uniref:zinc-ribbon domain-containing protein n=1 Tax=Levilactobacillus namurensis TaxID=380393 RepID=UPI0036F41178